MCRAWCRPASFNPRAPCGARRGGGDGRAGRTKFQSTRPVRGATAAHAGHVLVHEVSIHAPRAGRDRPGATAHRLRDVSIHAPRAGRDVADVGLPPRAILVSIHAPRAGRDSGAGTRSSTGACFNPRAPCGARHVRDGLRVALVGVSIHAPRAGRDVSADPEAGVAEKFQSTRPVRGAT